jgi:hypothetical protein
MLQRVISFPAFSRLELELYHCICLMIVCLASMGKWPAYAPSCSCYFHAQVKTTPFLKKIKKQHSVCFLLFHFRIILYIALDIKKCAVTVVMCCYLPLCICHEKGGGYLPLWLDIP